MDECGKIVLFLVWALKNFIHEGLNKRLTDWVIIATLAWEDEWMSH